MELKEIWVAMNYCSMQNCPTLKSSSRGGGGELADVVTLGCLNSRSKIWRSVGAPFPHRDRRWPVGQSVDLRLGGSATASIAVIHHNSPRSSSHFKLFTFVPSTGWLWSHALYCIRNCKESYCIQLFKPNNNVDERLCTVLQFFTPYFVWVSTYT